MPGLALDRFQVDFGRIETEDYEGASEEPREQNQEVTFLQQHGLDHGGVTQR